MQRTFRTHIFLPSLCLIIPSYTLMIKAAAIICPECRIRLYGTALLPDMRRMCPFCGNSYSVAGDNIEEAGCVVPDRVIPFLNDRKDFEREVLKCLARNEKTPLRIFDTISFKDVEGVFYPAYVSEDGRILGNNTLYSVYPAADCSSTIICMDKIISDTVYDHEMSAPYSGRFTDGRMFVPASPGSDGPDGLSGKGKLVFLPFWIVTFTYGGHRYRFIMSGADSTILHEFLPPELSAKKLLLAREISRVIQVFAWVSLICLIWNIWWIPVTLWSVWFTSRIVIRVLSAVYRRKARTTL